jgi:MacB-like periplasmic core domain
MHGPIQSLRYTLRLLRKSPGFTLMAILILSFGIGANTAIFSLIDGVLLKPLDYPNPNRLAEVVLRAPNSGRTNFDYADFLDINATQQSFQTLCVIPEMISNEINIGTSFGWELQQLQEPGMLQDVNFYSNGLRLPNPY